MDDKNPELQTIDDYIAQFPDEVRERMQHLRKLIKDAAPEASEKMSWGMPTFYFHGNLVHFAAHKKHLGFYPGASGVENFLDKLKEYHTSKGAIQFPLDKPLPLELIEEIVRFRLDENRKDALTKASKGKGKEKA